MRYACIQITIEASKVMPMAFNYSLKGHINFDICRDKPIRTQHVYYVGVYLLENGGVLYGRPRRWRPAKFNNPDYVIRVKFKHGAQ